MTNRTREENLALIQEVLEAYPEKARKDRAKHLTVNDPTLEKASKCITSNRKSLPGVMTIRGCAYAGSKGVVFGPIKDMIHLSHGPVGCGQYSRAGRRNYYTGLTGVNSFGTMNFTSDFQEKDIVFGGDKKLEKIIDRFSKQYDLKKPRTYRREARKNYLALAKSKKRSTRKIRKTIRKQLGYVRRDLSYLEQYMSEGYALTSKEIKLFLTIQKIYEQQEYMYKNKTHSVENRIVSIERPYLRPIVRGKVKAPVEFGAKFDLSIDNEGYGRIETISFDAYNESTCLQNAVERFKTRTGFYPERVLVDQIYRTRNNRAYCKLHGIRLSGPKLGRPTEATKEDKKQEYHDNTDRIEVERAFSLSKRCYGMGLIRTKLEETTLSSIALSVFVTNLFKIQARILFALFLLLRIFKFSTTDLSPNGA